LGANQILALLSNSDTDFTFYLIKKVILLGENLAWYKNIICKNHSSTNPNNLDMSLLLLLTLYGDNNSSKYYSSLFSFSVLMMK